MASYKVAFTLSGKQIKTVQKDLGKALAKLGYADVEPLVTKIERNQSRADRLGEAESLCQNAKDIVEELRDEMESWYDNMPENLQSADKGQQVETAKDELQSLADSLEIDFGSVEFPGMY